MPNFYCTREQLKRAAEISGSNRDDEVDDLIEAASREIERFTPSLSPRPRPVPIAGPHVGPVRAISSGWTNGSSR